MVLCDYCGEKAELVGGEKIYPHRPDLFSLRFFRCEPCAAYVGCHRGTVQPLGRLANAELRQWKQKAHAAFDPIWKSGRKNRNEAYKWLSEQMGLPVDKTHIGMFDVMQCKNVIAICQQVAV